MPDKKDNDPNEDADPNPADLREEDNPEEFNEWKRLHKLEGKE